jgi:hypothetical protein
MANKKIVGIAIILLVIGFGSVFAGEIASNGAYTVEGDGYGNFWINDTDRNVCILTVQAKPTENSGVYEFFCGGATRRRVSQATQLATILGNWNIQTRIAIWAAGVIYNEVCDLFE